MQQVNQPTSEPATVPSSPTSARRIDRGSLALSISALALGLLIVGVASRGPAAQADMVNGSGLTQVMTVRGASDEDVLLVLDGQNERLSVYRVENQASVEMYKRYDLPKVFGDARARAMGRK